MIDFRYDVQMLIEGTDLDEDAINDYFVENAFLDTYGGHLYTSHNIQI